jgi:hypothetical protein
VGCFLGGVLPLVVALFWVVSCLLLYWSELGSVWGTHLNGVVLCTPVGGNLHIF